MIDFKTFCIAMKAVWACRLIKCKQETWSIIPKKHLDNIGIKHILCMNIEHDKQIPIKLPIFYKEVIYSWYLSGGGNKTPKSTNDIRSQHIWGNRFIQSKGKTLFFKAWKDSNINFIDDLLDKNGNFLSGTKILDKLKVKTNWIAEYKTLLRSIPLIWKEKLSTANMEVKVKKQLQPFLQNEGKISYHLPLKAKDYYNILTKKIKKRTHNENYWNNIFPDHPIWEKVYIARIKQQPIKKLADFNYKLIHRILPNQENLCYWKISNSNKCRFGCEAIENYDHLFINCPRLSELKLKVEQILQQLGISVKLTLKTLIFGYKTVYPAYNHLNRLLTHIFYAIFKFWVKNEPNIEIKHWIFCELDYWKRVYIHTKINIDLLNKFLDKWSVSVNLDQI